MTLTNSQILHIELERIYRSVDKKMGDISIASVVRYVILTEDLIREKKYKRKLEETIKNLNHWLYQNSTASIVDRAGAENVIQDLQDALETKNER